MTDAIERNPLDAVEDVKFLATGRLFHALAADPKYRKEVLGLIKKAAPDTPIPEIDFESTVINRVDERLKPADEQIKKMAEQLEHLNKNLARESWKQTQGLSEEDAAEVEELAKAGKIGDASTAVEFWRSKQILGQPRGTRKTPPGAAEYLKKLHGISPRNGRALKEAAEAEAVRILSTTHKRAS